MKRFVNPQTDHIDPIWFTGEKEEVGYEQLVCGGDDPTLNHRHADISDNSRKSDRFLPWRVEGNNPYPREAGDFSWFLVRDEWVWIEFLGEEWYEETTRTGRYHQSRLGRQSVERNDGFIGWRDRQDAETLRIHDEGHRETVMSKIEDGERWGWMLPENRDCAGGGKVGGPKTATEINKTNRKKLKVISNGSYTVVCERDVIASRILEKILSLSPECKPMAPKDVHNIWTGGVSKGWYLVSVED